MTATAKPIRVSPSYAGTFLECPRCVWYEKREGKPRPRGAFPSLPGGLDRVIKEHFDGFRGKGKALPPELAPLAKENIRLYEDQTHIDKWRNWRTTDLKYQADGILVAGEIDDLLVTFDGKAVPFDYKSKGKIDKCNLEETEKYYKAQANLYGAQFAAGGFPVADFAIFLYFAPEMVVCGPSGQDCGIFDFDTAIVKMPIDLERGRRLIKTISEMLVGPCPPAGKECEYCKFAEGRIRR